MANLNKKVHVAHYNHIIKTATEKVVEQANIKRKREDAESCASKKQCVATQKTIAE